jgi:putative oxidoreductase
MNRFLPSPGGDIPLLIARIILGIVLFAHGIQKMIINGFAKTLEQFEALGIPLAIVSSAFVTVVEFVGGLLLILGVLTRVVVSLHLIVMVGAAIFVHASRGIFAQDGGWELVGVIAACELTIAAVGPGRYSLDRLFLPHERPRLVPLDDDAGDTGRISSASAGRSLFDRPNTPLGRDR